MRSVSVAVALILLAAAEVRAQSAAAVRAWEGELRLSTTIEGPANPNPPFDEFAVGRFNYPYALRDALTAQLVQASVSSGRVDEDFAILLDLQAASAGLKLKPEDVEVDDGLGGGTHA